MAKKTNTKSEMSLDNSVINRLRLERNKIKMQSLAGQLQNTSDLKKKRKELARAV